MTEFISPVVGATPGKLKELVGLYLTMPRIKRRVLECGQDVPGLLASVIPERVPSSSSPWESLPQPMAVLMGIDITVVPDLEDRAWRLREHSGCEVRGQDVLHENCPVIEEGLLSS